MKREIRVSEILLLMGYSFILLFMLSHDWIPLGSFNDIEAIREVKTVKELVTVTFINAGQIILLMGIIIAFIGKKYPIWIKLWLIIHPSCIFAGALIAWWIPYFFGYGAEARAESYEQMFGNTHTSLPVLNGIAPNTIHFLFHLTLLLCIILTIYISLTSRKKEE